MSRLLYVDAVGGVAGDMLLGALLHAGGDEEAVRAALGGLGLPGLDLVLGETSRHSIAARTVRVVSDEGHVHRNWPDVRELIDAATDLPARARERAQAVFGALARAEGRVHGIDPHEVHFHEVGAADAIADVCGIAVALESLGIDDIVCSALPVARGLIETAHGTLPLPAPAVLELLRGAPLRGVDLDVELVTGFGPVPAMRLEGIGYGAGSRDLTELPNLVRVFVGESVERHGRAHDVSLVETNLDDLPPEFVPDAVEACFTAGALDVWVTPTQMKKGRPGIVLSALTPPAEEQAVAEAILGETGSLGVRVSTVRRWELERGWRTVEVAGRQVRVKIASLDGRPLRMAPEHDDCAAVAAETGESALAVWSAALAAAREELERP
jgi:uncharacterized protein (TIGR00299 family) protein